MEFDFFTPLSASTTPTSFTPIDGKMNLLASPVNVFDGDFDKLFEKVLTDRDKNNSYQNSYMINNSALFLDSLSDINFVQTPTTIPPVGFKQNKTIQKEKTPVLNLKNNVKLQKKKKKKIKTKTNSKPKNVTMKRVRRKKKKTPVLFDFEELEGSEWILVHQDPKLENLVEEVIITSKTRCEEPSLSVPSVLYSSLKYEIGSTVILNKNVDLPFMMASCKVVHAENYTEYFKENKTVLKGKCETALTKGKQENYSGKMKVQFTDVSYHHKKHDFRWEIHISEPNKFDTPILIIRSGPFKVFARKPSKIAGKKRKRSSMKSFNDKLDDLIRIAKKFKPNEKKKAFNLVKDALVKLDPDYFYEFESD